MTLKGWRLVLNRLTFLPQRYILGVMGLLAVGNSYTMRVCLSITITQMVQKKATEAHIVGETCPDPALTGTNVTSSNDTVIYSGPDRYDWDEATQGLLLSAFYYGYLIMHLPGGLLAEKFGGKWICGLSLLTSSIATLLTKWAVKTGGAVGLFIIRVIQGMGQGPVTPSFALLLSRWVPTSERSRIGTMIFSGAQVGNIMSPIISGYILADGGDWAYVFYVFGTLGILWFIFWSLLCYNTPNCHPYISDEERDFLNTNLSASGRVKKLDPTPFKAILRSKPLWSLAAATIGYVVCTTAMLSDLPKYFSDVLKFNIKETGWLSALPYIANLVLCYTFAGMCDLGIKKGWHSITTGRKIYHTISALGPALFIILASYSGCDRIQAVVLFTISMALMSGFYSSLKVNTIDIARNYAGTCAALANGIAASAGIITPYLFGLLTPDQTVTQWRHAFWYVFCVLVCTNITYLIWGSGEQQWWDDVDKYGYPKDWKHGSLKKNNSDIEKKVVHPKHDHKPVIAWISFYNKQVN